MVYDVGLKQVVARPFSYISDMDNKLFISDVSATDHTLVPDGGQLLQGIAYLNDKFVDEAERKAYLDNKTKQMEALFDKYYPGWREATEVKRVSKKSDGCQRKEYFGESSAAPSHRERSVLFLRRWL